VGFLDVLKGIGKVGLGFATGGPVGAIGAGLGAISQGQAHNRGEKFGGQLDMERALIERELMNNQSRKGAWQGLLSAQHTINPGPRPQLSRYSVAPRQAGAAELSGADALTREVSARLQRGPSQAAIDPKLLDPGLMERILGYGSAGMGALGIYQQSRQIPNQGGNALARILATQQAPRI